MAPPFLTIVVDDGSDQLVLLQHGEKLQGFALAQDVAALQALSSSHQVVHLYTGPVIRQLPPPSHTHNITGRLSKDGCMDSEFEGYFRGVHFMCVKLELHSACCLGK